MKTIRNLLLGGAVVVFCGSMANAQIIYSNAFDGPATNLNLTVPNVANSLAGGTNTAVWHDALGTNNTYGYVLANGSNNCTGSDSWVLPFTPQPGHFYTITAKMTWRSSAHGWIGFGFCVHYPDNLTNGGRFADGNVAGVDWIICQPGTGEQWFAGPLNFPSASGLAGGNAMPTSGTYTVTINLDTRAPHYVMSCYIGGKQFGTDYTYPTANSPSIGGVGFTQNHPSTATNFTWSNFTLTTALLPIIAQQPTSQGVGVGAGYTNTVSAFADTSGGTLSYQWYDNNVPITGVSTNPMLIINPVSLSDAGTNYYAVVANSYGSVTSAPASLVVYTNPVLTATIPASHTNVMTLFGGGNIGGTNYFGSSPTFSVSVAGAQPLSYTWLTNGVVVGGATGSSFTLTNCQMNSPTHFTCIAANSYGQVTNSWSATYIAAPTAPYPQAVLADQPIAFWRMNEPGDGFSISNVICNDYQSGNNGIYTNTILGNQGYNSSEPAETTAYFGAIPPSYAGQIQGVNFGVPAGQNAEFSVEAWVQGFNGGDGSAIITKGIYQVNDSFALNLDRTANHDFEFAVRTPAGVGYTADYTNTPVLSMDATWHHVVGVCDEAHTNLSLYIDGVLVARTYIPANAGLMGNNDPVTIGAGSTSASSMGNIQYSAYIDDVAAYNYALSPGQIINQVGSILGPFAPYFIQAPATNVTLAAYTTLSIPAMAAGTSPVGYVWTNVTAGSVVATGVANTASQLDATLNYGNVPLSWNSNQLELIVTNAYGSANALVTLSVTNGINLNPTNIVFSVTNGNELKLSWPADYTGWQLQSQTNSLAVGLGTNWANVNGSTTTNQVLVPIDTTNGAVFYRLIH